MKKVSTKIFLLAAITSASLTGCYYDVGEELYPAQTNNPPTCDTANVTYSAKVLPLIQGNCYSCHAGTAPSGNVNLDGYSNLKMYADNGLLMGTIRHSNGFSSMPKGMNKLSDCSISIIQSWINKGTQNN